MDSSGTGYVSDFCNETLLLLLLLLFKQILSNVIILFLAGYVINAVGESDILNCSMGCACSIIIFTHSILC
jgi:hypothetical protein